jgi:glc operon protein GlcG
MIRQVSVLLAAVLLLSGLAGAQGLATQKVLTLQAAKEIAAAAESFAKEKGWKVNVAIVDAAGDLLYFQRMLGVQSGSITVAQRKAESAAKFKRPTKVFSDAIAGAPGLAMVPGALAVEGGLPITWKGDFLGGIGISGVTSAQDGIIAKAALDALPEILE